MDYQVDDIISEKVIRKGKYVKQTKNRFISLGISLILAVVSVFTALKLESKFSNVIENRPYFELFNYVKEKYVDQFQPIQNDILLASFIYKSLIYIIIYSIVVKIVLGIIISFTKKSIFSYNHPIFYQFISIWNTLNLALIFVIQLYTKLIDLNIIGIFAIDSVKIQLNQVIPQFVNYSINLFNTDIVKFFMEIGIFLLINIPLIISIGVILIKSILSSFLVYISFIPLVAFSGLLYFKYLFEKTTRYVFENYDKDHYVVRKIRYRTYSYKFRKYLLCLVIIPSIYVLFYFNPYGLFKFPQLVNYKIRGVDINPFICAYIVTGIILVFRFYVSISVSSILGKLDRQYSHGYKLSDYRNKSW